MFPFVKFLETKNQCYRLMCSCAICGYYDSDHEVYHLLRCNTMQSSKYVAICTHGFEELTAPVFREEDCGYRFIQNVCTYLPDYKLSNTRRHTLSLYYVYWTVHLCNSWRIKDQLDITYYFISLLMYSTCFGH